MDGRRREEGVGKRVETNFQEEILQHFGRAVATTINSTFFFLYCTHGSRHVATLSFLSDDSARDFILYYLKIARASIGLSEAYS